MKRNVTFLFCLLMSWAAVSFAQPAVPVQFSSDDGIETHWYYISFDRQDANNKVWAVDLTQSGEVQQKARVNNDKTQQWKLVGNADNFYFVNRATGYIVAYASSPITDSNGKPVPLLSSDNAVYYIDKTITPADAANCQLVWIASGAGKPGWGIADPERGAALNWLNDRGGRNVCWYYFTDAGCLVKFYDADAIEIRPASQSLYRDGLVNNTSKMTLQVNSNNISENITGSISGPDAATFGFDKGINTISNGIGKLYITFSPNELKDYNASLTLSSPGAPDVTVALSGTAFAESDLPFTVSSEDNSNEHWYYLQFNRKSANNLVWSLNDTTRMVVQDTLKAGVIRQDQHWKICGDWEYGYYIVNRKTGQEIAYNTKDVVGADGDRRIFTDVPPDGIDGANRYVAVAAGSGNYLEFTRYNKGKTWQIANRTVSFYNTPDRNFICDIGGQYLGNYTININNTEMNFISANTATILAPSANSIKLNAASGETVSTTLHVAGAINTTADIAVSITGANEGIFTVTPAILPVTGGDLTITFTCPEDSTKQYVGLLTLKVTGAQDVVVKVTGIPTIQKPQISTDGNEYWYYLQFVRPAKVWQGNGDGEEITQVSMIDDEQSQHWKFIDASDGGYLIENRKGGQIAFELITDPDGDYYGGNAFLANEGLSVIFVEDNQLLLSYHKNDGGYGTLNDLWGMNITVYWEGDEGNYLKYIPAGSKIFTGIKTPSCTDIDSNDTLVSVKYYTLQGIEVKQPGATGIYIIKKLYASGKMQSIKVLMHKK